VTVARADGQQVAYDPQRLRGVNVYTSLPREFSTGDRIQFTHNNKDSTCTTVIAAGSKPSAMTIA
jgi:hypothetical protein